MYTYVYVRVPSQVGIGLIVGAPGVKVLPQLSTTTGKVGDVFVAAGHATVAPASAGSAKVSYSIIYVNDQG